MKSLFLSLLTPKLRPESPYADLYVRSVAAAFDIFLLFLIFYNWFAWMDVHYFPDIGMDFLQKFSAATSPEIRADMLAQWVVRSLLQLGFFGVAIISCQVAFGNTPGKWIMGLKVVRRTTHGEVSPWRFTLRYVGYFLACGSLMIGMLWIGFNRERRGWHDYIAGTVVLNLRPRGWYWQHVKRGIFYVWRRLFPQR